MVNIQSTIIEFEKSIVDRILKYIKILSKSCNKTLNIKITIQAISSNKQTIQDLAKHDC